jgi:hypothetical protein
MAAARHNLTRRALLGAGVVAPVLLGGGGVAVAAAVGPTASWNRALARFRRAESALAECRAGQAALPAAQRAWPHSQALDDAFGRLDDVRFAALRRLLRVPAPDLAELALKIDLIVADQARELTGAEDCIIRLGVDARRLAHGVETRPWDAADHLDGKETILASLEAASRRAIRS